jgi:serine/threonine protein kinase
MINESGRVQIIDFGLSKVHHMSGFTTTHEGQRTPRYCAPELLRQEKKEGVIKPTYQSDVFGFAMTMLEVRESCSYLLMTLFHADLDTVLGQ